MTQQSEQESHLAVILVEALELEDISAAEITPDMHLFGVKERMWRERIAWGWIPSMRWK